MLPKEPLSRWPCLQIGQFLSFWVSSTHCKSFILLLPVVVVGSLNKSSIHIDLDYNIKGYSQFIYEIYWCVRSFIMKIIRFFWLSFFANYWFGRHCYCYVNCIILTCFLFFSLLSPIFSSTWECERNFFLSFFSLLFFCVHSCLHIFVNNSFWICCPNLIKNMILVAFIIKQIQWIIIWIELVRVI